MLFLQKKKQSSHCCTLTIKHKHTCAHTLIDHELFRLTGFWRACDVWLRKQERWVCGGTRSSLADETYLSFVNKTRHGHMWFHLFLICATWSTIVFFVCLFICLLICNGVTLHVHLVPLFTVLLYYFEIKGHCLEISRFLVPTAPSTRRYMSTFCIGVQSFEQVFKSNSNGSNLWAALPTSIWLQRLLKTQCGQEDWRLSTEVRNYTLSGLGLEEGTPQ